MRYSIRRGVRQAMVPALCIMATVYFVYHLVQGDRGIIALNRLNTEMSQAEARLAVLQAEKQSLELKVALLRPDGLDRDLLDERSRDVLGMVREDEMIVFYDGEPD